MYDAEDSVLLSLDVLHAIPELYGLRAYLEVGGQESTNLPSTRHFVF